MTAKGITVRRKRHGSRPNKENEMSFDLFLTEFQASTDDKELLALSESILEASLHRSIQMILAEHVDGIVSKARDIVKKAASGSNVLGNLVVAVHLLRAVWTLELHQDLLIRLLYHIVTTALKTKSKDSTKLIDCGLAALETLASVLGGLIASSNDGTFFEFRREDTFPIPVLRRTTKRKTSSLTSDQILSIGIASVQAGAQMLAQSLNIPKQSDTVFLSNFLNVRDAVGGIESLLLRAQSPLIKALSITKQDALEIHMKQSRKILTDLAKVSSKQRSKLYAMAIELQIKLSLETSEQIGKICRTAIQYGKTLQSEEMTTYHEQVGALLDNAMDPTKLPPAYVEYCAHRALHTNICGNHCDSDCCFAAASTRLNHRCGPVPATSSEQFLLVFSMMLKLKEALSTDSSGTFAIDPVDVEHRVSDFVATQHSDGATEMYCKQFALVGLETALGDHVKESLLLPREIESTITILAVCVGPMALKVASFCSKPGPFINLCSWAFSSSITAMDALDKQDFSVVAMIFELDLPSQMRERLGRLLYSQAISRRDRGLSCCTQMAYALAFLHQIQKAAEYKIPGRLSVLSSMFADHGDHDRALLACVTSIAMELQGPPQRNSSSSVESDSILLSLVQRCSAILLGQCPTDTGNKLANRIRELWTLLRSRPIQNNHDDSTKELSIADSLFLLCCRDPVPCDCLCCSELSVQSLFQGMLAPRNVDANESVACVAELLRLFKKSDEESKSLQTFIFTFGLSQIKTLQLDVSTEVLASSLFRLIWAVVGNQELSGGNMTTESIVETTEELREICDNLQAIQKSCTSVFRLASITIVAVKLQIYEMLRQTEKHYSLRSMETLNISDLIHACFGVLSGSTSEESDLEVFIRQSTIACILRLSEIQLLWGEDIDALITLKKLSSSPMIKESAFIVNASIFMVLSSDRISSGLVMASTESPYDVDDDDLLHASLLRYQACIDGDLDKVKNSILRLNDEFETQRAEGTVKSEFFHGCLYVMLSMGLAECSGRIGDTYGELDSLLRCLDKTKTITSSLFKSIDFAEPTSFGKRALHWHFSYRCHERKIDCLRRIADVYLRLGDYTNCMLFTYRYGNAIIGSPFSSCLRKYSHQNRFENIVGMLSTAPRQSLQDHRWRRDLLRLASHCFEPNNVRDTMSEYCDQLFDFGRKLATSCYYREIEIFKDASEVQRIIQGHDLSKGCSKDLNTNQPTFAVGEFLSHAIGDSTLSLYNEVLPQLVCDQRLDALTNPQTRPISNKDQLHLGKNATTLGCTNVTRCWSRYLLGLSALNEAKTNGELRDLWRSTDGRQLKHIPNARHIFERVLIDLGSSNSDLKRKAQRSLALVLGPDQRSDILRISSSELIHLSLNEGKSSHFGSQSYSSIKADNWTALSIQRLKEVKRNIPEGLQFLAMASCPTGELLLDIIDTSDDDQTCCVFPPSSESISDFLMCPLSDLLASNNAQLENSGNLNREDTTDRRCWRRERREMDEAFAQLMQRAKDLFVSANLPLKSQQFLFGRTNGNLSSRFEEVANGDHNDTKQTSKTSLVLILDEMLQKFPFESLEFFEDRAICRLPSLFFVSGSSRPSTQIKHDRVSYILNPESDLDDTEERLLPLLLGLGSNQWASYVKKKPPSSDLRHALGQESGLIMYFGHGGGERVISKDQLKAVGDGDKGVRASVILMGCSSGLLHSPNQDKGSCVPCTMHFQPDGLILQYLILGSPCAIGNLWDVTDRDIDMFTERMLRSLFEDGLSTAQSVASARSACKYRFLTGGAPVCYGLPAYIYNKA